MAGDADTARSGPQPPTTTVTVGILTYRRPASLAATLRSLATAGLLDELVESSLDTGGTEQTWTLAEVLVIDNDDEPSAAQAVADTTVELGAEGLIRHVHEPTPGLAAARNRALDEATGDILAFIDDDERATPGWPGGLVDLLVSTDAALVGAPVDTRFETDPPAWVRRGGFFQREDPQHGSEQAWLRSGNLAIDVGAVREAGVRFDPRFGQSGGEDVAFSFAAVAEGLRLRWSSGQAVVEDIGPDRTTARWILRRWRRASAAYTRAQLAYQPSGRLRTWSLVAVRASAHGARGTATALAGVVTLDWSRVIKGVAGVCRGIGLLEGLRDRPSEAYGGAGTKPHGGRQPRSATGG